MNRTRLFKVTQVTTSFRISKIKVTWKPFDTKKDTYVYKT